MKVFISWSGEASRQVAEALRGWLPSVIQAVEPWMSAEDMMGGARWRVALAEELENTDVGISCLTPNNLRAPWILYEAGAVTKSVDESFLVPYLLGLETTQVTGPLAEFQAVRATEEGTKDLLKTINEALGDEGLDAELLSRSFGMWWPELEPKLAGIDVSADADEAAAVRGDTDMLAELLERVREMQRDRWRLGTAHDELEVWYGAESPLVFTPRRSRYLDETRRALGILSPEERQALKWGIERLIAQSDPGAIGPDWLATLFVLGKLEEEATPDSEAATEPSPDL